MAQIIGRQPTDGKVVMEASARVNKVGGSKASADVTQSELHVGRG
jgi:hypothetical protein